MQCDQKMKATCNASLLQENLSESISDIYGNHAKNLSFQHHNAASCLADSGGFRHSQRPQSECQIFDR